MKQIYEELTVPELKDLAEERGIELLSDARKPEIIAALEASDQLLVVGTDQPKQGETPEGKNVYTYQTSSTTEGLMSQEDFWKIKLTA
jgi:hypothetical protein